MKRFLLIFTVILPLFTQAQTLKTGVLVIGSRDGAFAAAIQATVSSVNTTIVTGTDGFTLSDLQAKPKTGVIETFFKKAHQYLKLADSVSLPAMTKQLNNEVLKKWSDSSKTFSVINQIDYKELKKISSGWELELVDGRKIRAKALIIEGNADQLLKNLKLPALTQPQFKAFSYKDNYYRTSVSSNSKQQYLPFDQFLLYADYNLFTIEANDLDMGQAVGASAAFPAFFGRKLVFDDLNKIQNELITYKRSIFPVEDVKIDDANWAAIQKVLITGVLKADSLPGEIKFHPDQTVHMDDIKSSIKAYYFKASIWFEDYKDQPLNLENAISLVCALGNKSPITVTKLLEKNWKTGYKFSSEFNLKNNISRREFAVLAGDFLQVFEGSHFDKTGRILR